MTEAEMVGWHHRFNGPEFEQALGDGEQGSPLMCSSPWGCRVVHNRVTEQQHSITSYKFILGVGLGIVSPLSSSWITMRRTQVRLCSEFTQFTSQG